MGLSLFILELSYTQLFNWGHTSRWIISIVACDEKRHTPPFFDRIHLCVTGTTDAFCSCMWVEFWFQWHCKNKSTELQHTISGTILPSFLTSLPVTEKHHSNQAYVYHHVGGAWHCQKSLGLQPNFKFCVKHWPRDFWQFWASTRFLPQIEFLLLQWIYVQSRFGHFILT